MSRCAHMQSDYEYHRLPRCSKCKVEFQLVLASYTDRNGKTTLVEEWECPKGCGKVVPKHMIRENKLSEQDKKLSDWCKNEQRKEKRRKK